MQGTDMFATLVQMDDVLLAMAESVMERQPKPFNPQLKFRDARLPVKIGKKPPREIFYRQTTTFLSNVPPPVSRRLCTCNLLCSATEAAPATVKCHSCAIYEPSGAAYYCAQCFAARHPWHRTQHVFSAVERDEDIAHTRQVAHRLAEAARYEREAHDQLDVLTKTVAPQVKSIADDAQLEEKMRSYGRHVVSLEEKLQQMRERLRQELQEDEIQNNGSGHSSVKKSYVSAKILQIEFDEKATSFRVDSSSRAASVKMITTNNNTDDSAKSNTLNEANILLIEQGGDGDDEPPLTLSSDEKDHQTTVDVVIDVDKPESSEPETTTASSLAQNEEVHIVQLLNEEIHPQQPSNDGIQMESEKADVQEENEESTPPSDAIDEQISQEEAHRHRAATNIQRIFKARIAKKIVSSMVAMRLIRVFSPTHGREYYFNRATQTSSWTPSKLLLPHHHDELDYIHEPQQRVIWTCKAIVENQRNGNRHYNTQEAAVQVLQGFGRCILSRQRLLRKADQRFRRVLDTSEGSEGQFFYANMITGETSWTKPPFYYTSEPPIYAGEEEIDLSEEDETAPKKKKKSKSKKKTASQRSPRVNRMR